MVPENSEFLLEFLEPDISYKTLTWYRPNRDQKIVEFVSDGGDGGTLEYYGDFCVWNPSCPSSDKGELNTNNGALTIYSLSLEDEDFYYYSFTSFDARVNDTGIKYEIYVEVHGK